MFGLCILPNLEYLGILQQLTSTKPNRDLFFPAPTVLGVIVHQATLCNEKRECKFKESNEMGVATNSLRKALFIARQDECLSVDGHDEIQGKIEAINRSQAVIEFSPDGIVLTANNNFLKTMGYQHDEIVGQHHRIFVKPDYAGSSEYEEFWRSLRSGNFKVSEFERISKGGNPVWIQASYNPIFDRQGEVVKVIKFATDITEVVNRRLHTGEIGKTIAYSVNELASTIQEIAVNVNSTAVLAQQVEQTTESTVEMAQVLDDGSRKIAEVVTVIQNLASQTNLLALNATIEAARAGQAGLGFAVVAKEVKELALETAKATRNIELIIGKVQNEMQMLLGSIEQISGSIGELSSNTNSIAAAIEEQSATSNNLSQTAQSLLDLSR